MLLNRKNLLEDNLIALGAATKDRLGHTLVSLGRKRIFKL